MSLKCLMDNFEQERDETISKIQDLNHKLEEQRSNYAEKVSQYFLENPCENFDFESLKNLTKEQRFDICKKICKFRELRDEEISNELLCQLEMQDEKDSILLDLFNNANDKQKLKIALYSSGMHRSNLFRHKDIEKYLIDEYGIFQKHVSVNEGNYLNVHRCDYGTNQYTIRISTKKDCYNNINKLSENIVKLINNDFLANNFLIRNSSNSKIFLILHDDNLNILKPSVCIPQRQDQVLYTGEGASLVAQIKSCLRFIVANCYFKI